MVMESEMIKVNAFKTNTPRENKNTNRKNGWYNNQKKIEIGYKYKERQWNGRRNRAVKNYTKIWLVKIITDDKINKWNEKHENSKENL